MKQQTREKWINKLEKLLINWHYEYIREDGIDRIKDLISDTTKNARKELRKELLELPLCEHIEKVKVCILCADNIIRNLK